MYNNPYQGESCPCRKDFRAMDNLELTDTQPQVSMEVPQTMVPTVPLPEWVSSLSLIGLTILTRP